MNQLPSVKTGLLRNPLDGQVLVYDTADGRVHLLDMATSCVFDLLEEGGWTPSTINAELARRLGVASTDGLLLLALDELQKAGLLETEVVEAEPLPDVTRREMVRKLALAGVTAVLVPTIATLAASKAYAGGTLLPVGQPCGTSPGLCASGRCCGGQCARSPSSIPACTSPGQPCGPGVVPANSSSLPDCTCCSGVCIKPGNSAQRCD